MNAGVEDPHGPRAQENVETQVAEAFSSRATPSARRRRRRPS
ncbi:hypothetical protein [Lentzea guizhouensis]|nr:hypothetical protein [Lentzea guizhouensis]